MSSNECAALAEIHNAFNPEGVVLPKWFEYIIQNNQTTLLKSFQIAHRTTTIPPGGFVNGSCCDWQWPINSDFTYGVSCDSSRSTVTYLRLNELPNGYALRGTIPPDAIAYLTGLRGLEIGGNPMTGTIPPQLGQLTSLTILHIQRNSISGALPSEIALLTSLNVFAIDNSKITRLPRNFGLLTALDGINCWLEGVYDTCRPNPYPEACLANNVNTYMNSLTPCPLYTVTTNSVSPTNIVSYTSTTIQTTSSIDSFTTRSITVGPTSTETSIQRIQNLNQNQPSVITRQQKYIIFSSLLGVIFTLFILLSILRRRLQSRVKLAQKVDPAPQ